MEVRYDSLGVLMAGAREACLRILESVAGLPDDACSQPSLLPGWSRGHVLSHLARNADGQARMLEGARLGEIRDQYPGGDQAREHDIDKGAGRPTAEIVRDLTVAQAGLERVWQTLDRDAWHRPTRARAGTRPALASVWARWRECEIHHVDLNLGYRPGDWPGPFVDTMLPPRGRRPFAAAGNRNAGPARRQRRASRVAVERGHQAGRSGRRRSGACDGGGDPPRSAGMAAGADDGGIGPGHARRAPGFAADPHAMGLSGVTVWYIRHGHNLANQTGELSHKITDYPLTPLGIGQASALAGRLAGTAMPGIIYSSPLRRAAQTAGIIAARTGSDVRILEQLRELNVGELDGRSDSGAWAIYHAVLADWHTGNHDRAFPGGENYHQMTARLAGALRHVLDHAAGSPALIVGHGGIIRTAIPALCPGTPLPETDIPNCGIAELDISSAGDGITGRLIRWPDP